MTFTAVPKIPIRKSKEDVEFYVKNGPIFGDILSTLRDLIRKNQASCIEESFIDLCMSLFGDDVEFPFANQANYFGEMFEHAMCISVNDVIAHGRPVPFKKGDIVSIDCGLSLPHNNRRLNFDAAFTVVCGCKDTPWWTVGPHIALKNIITNQPKDTRSIAAIIQATAQDLNLQQVVSLTGHGIGYMLHEEPVIHNAVGPFLSVELFEGLVFCAEPIFVNPGNGRGSSAIASTCIGADGWEVSTTSGHPSSHFETMFGVIDGQIVDLIGVSKWKL